MILLFHERSYNENYTPSRPLWEVKSHLAWSVVRWVTTCEARVLFVLFFILSFFHSSIHSLFVPHSFLFIFVSFIHSLSFSFHQERFLSVFFSLLSHTQLSHSSLSEYSQERLKLLPAVGVWVSRLSDQSEEREFGWEEKWNPSRYEPKTLISTQSTTYLKIWWSLAMESTNRISDFPLSLIHNSSFSLLFNLFTRTLHTTIWPENFKKHKLTIHEGKVLIKWIPRWLAYTQFNQPSRSFLWFWSIISKIYPWIWNRMIILC